MISDVQRIVAWKRSKYGIRTGGVNMNSNKCPMRRSELHKDSSMILTTNSRAGCDIAWAPSPRPYQRPVHHALLVSSCLNSRDRKTAIRALKIARCMAMTAIRPRTACDVFHCSRSHCANVVSTEAPNKHQIRNAPKIRKMQSFQLPPRYERSSP